MDTPIPSEQPKPPDIPNTEEENQVHSTEDNSVEVDITQDGVGEIDPTPVEYFIFKSGHKSTTTRDY